MEEVEGEMEKWIKESEGEGKWKRSRKRWWNERVEEEYRKTRKVEKRWEEGRNERRKKEMEEARKNFKRVVYEEKGRHWGDYLEKIGVNEAFKWIKTDRDFVVDVPGIVGENGEIVEGDEEKGEAIVRGLGKREEKEQEEEGEEWEVELDEEEVEESVMKQEEKKAPGENGLGGKIVKMVWRNKGGREWIMGVYKRSLEMGYVLKRWRRSVGIVMRKPKKPDYSLPSSYRIINLLDVVGKGLERVVNGRLEK